MDLRKRNNTYDKEIELNQKEMTNKLIDAGFDQTTAGLIIKAIGKTGGATAKASSAIGQIRSPNNSYTYNNVNY